MKGDNILFDFQTISLYHVRMVEIKSSDIEKAVYELCVNANTMYDAKLYANLIQKFNNACGDDKIKYSNILKNIKLSFETKRPLCQDTGQVIIFAKIGNKVTITGKTFNEAVNNAVEKAYTENFYRKSVVTNTLFNRANTRTNTPAIIYTDIVDGDNIHIDLTAKGAGSENCSVIKMFNPSAAKTDIFKFIKDSVILAGEKSCPPLVLGIGAGGTLEYAALLSKKAFFHTPDEAEQQFIDELREYLKDIEESILDIRLCTASTHIASLPVALTISCHSTRHAGCTIKGNDIFYQKNTCDYLQTDDDSSFREVSSCDTETIRSLLPGENILLSGEIYTARDAAHKKFEEYFKQHSCLPVDLKDKIIFYAGPCPAAKDEIIGPIGPTTAARMDSFCELTYSNGLLASIGKGERSAQACEKIKKYNGKYLIAQGGIACLLSQCVKSCETAAFEELGTEAVRKLYVEKLPLKVVV